MKILRKNSIKSYWIYVLGTQYSLNIYYPLFIKNVREIENKVIHTMSFL